MQARAKCAPRLPFIDGSTLVTRTNATTYGSLWP